MSELEKSADMSSYKSESLKASNASLSLALASQGKKVDTLRAQTNKEEKGKGLIPRIVLEKNLIVV